MTEALDADRLHRIAREAGLGEASVFLIELATRRVRSTGAERRHYPASMIKTPLAVAAGAAVEAGRLAWSDSVAVGAANLTVNDAPSPLVAGYAATVEELVGYMIERSDNVATNVLFDVLDRDWATAAIRRLGFPRTAFARKLSGALPLIDDPAATGRNTHPPAEAAALFARIAAGDVPAAGAIGTFLSRQYWNAKLSRGLETGDVFAHKTGDTDEVSHDGGILTLDSGARYVIVVYTGLPAGDDTDPRFGTFMRTLRPYLHHSGEEAAPVRSQSG